MELTKELWGKSACGKEIYLYTLKNESGAYVQLSSVGAGIVSVVVPDKDMALVPEKSLGVMPTELLLESSLWTEWSILSQ